MTAKLRWITVRIYGNQPLSTKQTAVTTARHVLLRRRHPPAREGMYRDDFGRGGVYRGEEALYGARA